jgi:lysylphosphatidylglycerol synthetase-like protein (DUF2156 family)
VLGAAGEFMETYYTIGKLAVTFAFIAQSSMLLLQAAALRRHGSGFFAMLCISSICGLVYAFLTGLPYFLPLQTATTLFLLKIALVFGASGGILAILGTALLFRSYRKLSEALARSSAGST